MVWCGWNDTIINQPFCEWFSQPIYGDINGFKWLRNDLPIIFHLPINMSGTNNHSMENDARYGIWGLATKKNYPPVNSHDDPAIIFFELEDEFPRKKCYVPGRTVYFPEGRGILWNSTIHKVNTSCFISLQFCELASPSWLVKPLHDIMCVCTYIYT